MNMKKTIAALAAGAVAVSAMATTVSALEDKTLTYNLVRHDKTGASTVDLTSTIANVQGGTEIKIGLANLPKDYSTKKLTVIFKDTAGGAGSKTFNYAWQDYGADNFVDWTAQNEVTIPATALAEGSYDVTIVANYKTPYEEWAGSVNDVAAAIKAAGTYVYAEFTGSTTTVTEGEDTIIPADTVLSDEEYAALTTANKALVTQTKVYTATEDIKVVENKATATIVDDQDVAIADAKVTVPEDAAAGVYTFDGTKWTDGTGADMPATIVVTPGVSGIPANSEITVVGATFSLEVDAEDTLTADEYATLSDAQKADVDVKTVYTASQNIIVEGEDKEETTTDAEATKITNADVKASNYAHAVDSTDYPFFSNVKGSLDIIDYLENDDNNLQNKGKPADYKSYWNTEAVLNDAIENYDSVTFTFNTAVKKVNDKGAYDDNGAIDCTSFAQHLYNYYYGWEDTKFTGYDWAGYNLFQGALVINEYKTMSLAETDYFDWTATSLSFSWDAIVDGAMTDNDYARYLHSMKLATSSAWYWDNMVVELTAGAEEDASSDAGVDGDGAEIDDEPAADDTVEEPAEEPAEDEAPADEPAEEPAPEVSNPTTGNASVALAVIPVALAAAAVVAKKRS